MQKLQESINLNDGVLENLRATVDRDSITIGNLQTEVRQLKADIEKKNSL